MQSNKEWLSYVLKREALDDGHIYLYADDSSRYIPLWMVFEASARRLQQLLPHLVIRQERLADSKRMVSIIRGICLVDVLPFLPASPFSNGYSLMI